LTLFTSPSGSYVRALLVESPEPLSWRRIRKWISLTPSGNAGGLQGITVLWNGDGTRGLIVVQGQARGLYELRMTFQGNIGAEAPSITRAAKPVVEMVDLGSIVLGPRRLIVDVSIDVSANESEPRIERRVRPVSAGRRSAKKRKAAPSKRRGGSS
jgi:hypothetical protein